MKDNRKLILPFVLLSMTAAAVAAPENEKLFYTFEGLENRNGWLDSQNGAGLTTYEEENFTQVKVAGVITNGALRNFYDPASKNDYRLDMRSYRRVNNIMLYGQFLFDYDIKKNQAWSSMTYPESSPLHIGDKTPGNQIRETYFINGGVAIPVGAAFTLGGYFDFKGVSNAKKKDIRNKNSFSLYHFKPSLMWEVGNFRLGANYNFGSETETIEWMVYGDKMQHEVFHFEGLWFGPSEMTSTTITERRFERKIQEGAFQIEYATPEMRLFNQFLLDKELLKVYLKAEEQRGGENEKAHYAYQGQMWLPATLFNHTIKWNADHSFVKSYQNLQQRELVNYVYRYVQYGKILRYTESDWNAGLSYELLRLREKESWKPNWSLLFESGFSYRQQKFRTYPSVFSQQIHKAYAALGFDKHLFFDKGSLELLIKALWQTGWGDPIEINNPDATNGYKYQAELQQIDYAFQAARRIGGDLSVGYTWFQNKQTGVAPFTKACYSYCEATNTLLKDKSRSKLEFTVGINF